MRTIFQFFYRRKIPLFLLTLFFLFDKFSSSLQKIGQKYEEKIVSSQKLNSLSYAKRKTQKNFSKVVNKSMKSNQGKFPFFLMDYTLFDYEEDEVHFSQSSIEKKTTKPLITEPENSFYTLVNDRSWSKEDGFESNIGEPETKKHYYSLYLEQVDIFKKNHRESGVGLTLFHRANNKRAVLTYEAYLYSFQELKDYLESICEERGDKLCSLTRKVQSLEKIRGNLPSLFSSMAGYLSFNSQCPLIDEELKLPVFQISRYVSTLESKKKKYEIWLPEIHKLKHQWTTSMDKKKGKLYQFHADGQNATPFSFYKMETICVIGEIDSLSQQTVGSYCHKDESCLSGCCKRGVCSSHNPSKNLYCSKEVGDFCMANRFCVRHENKRYSKAVYYTERRQIPPPPPPESIPRTQEALVEYYSSLKPEFETVYLCKPGVNSCDLSEKECRERRRGNGEVNSRPCDNICSAKDMESFGLGVHSYCVNNKCQDIDRYFVKASYESNYPAKACDGEELPHPKDVITSYYDEEKNKIITKVENFTP